MQGVDRDTGERVGGVEHLRQSITDILMTRKGTRVMCRDYGSDVPNLVDDPVNDEFALDLFIAVEGALRAWEPRFGLTRIGYTQPEPGRVEITLEGVHMPDGEPVRLEGIVIR